MNKQRSIRLCDWVSHNLLSEDNIFLGTALLVGIGTGLGAVLFRYLIRGVEWIGYTWVPQITAAWGKSYVLFIPIIGGLLVGPLVYFFAREAKGHGVPEVMEAVALRGGRIRPIVAVVKSFASALTIGSGGSVGREGPIVQIGSALGSFVGQYFNFSEERVRNLVACGAAGGIAATFNSPIAGVVFALEIILGKFNIRYFSTVVISAVSASVIGQAVFGTEPAFLLDIEYQINSVWEYAFYPGLGIIAAVVGSLFVFALYWSEDTFAAWKNVPEWFQPAIGGLLLGAMALTYPLVTGITWDKIPQIYNVGYDIIQASLQNELTLYVVLILLVLKILATIITLGSGGSGGVFAPSLFIGAMLGTAYGIILNNLFPGIVAPPGAYALVGMAAVFSAGAQAPITAIIILFELTDDYNIILPLMLTVVISTLIARKLLKGESIYTLKLARRGIQLKRGRDVNVLEGVLIEEVMNRNIDTVSTSTTIVELSDMFTHLHHHGFPVLDAEGRLDGIVTITDLERAVSQHVPRTTTVGEIDTPYDQLHIVFPDEPMGGALTRLSTHDIGQLPVVSRDDPHHILGLVRRADIISAYRIARTRRNELHYRAKRMEVRNEDDGTEFIQLKLEATHGIVGKTVLETAELLPHECILISIRRNDSVLIPHGSTVFQADDQITAFVQNSASEDFFECMTQPKDDESSASLEE